MGKLTVHSLVRNEPFIYYSIKSVYDAVDAILLYDTGSTDYTVDDIHLLLDEDIDNKIDYKQIVITDETGWSKNYGKSQTVTDRGLDNNVASLRQKQIDETKTDFFLVLDGDEVYYQSTIERICEYSVRNMSADKAVGYIAMEWFVDLHRKFLGGRGTSPSPIGRLFRTEGARIIGNYPNEYHSYDNIRMTRRSPLAYRAAKKYPPIAHFEIYLKPWRKTQVLSDLEPVEQLPEVMEANDYFARRFEEENRIR